MNSDYCEFCHIISGETTADIVYQDEAVTAFWDRSPAAPVHILVIPNIHIPSLNEAKMEDAELLGKMVLCAQRLAENQAVANRGYRLVFNIGPEGGQTVYHLHLHLIAGKRLPIFHG